MKRQYITPSIFCVKLDTRKAFLEDIVSVREETATGDDGGWAREDNNTDENNENNNRNSIWDNAW